MKGRMEQAIREGLREYANYIAGTPVTSQDVERFAVHILPVHREELAAAVEAARLDVLLPGAVTLARHDQELTERVRQQLYQEIMALPCEPMGRLSVVQALKESALKSYLGL